MTLANNDLKRGLAHNETQLASDALEAELQYVSDLSRSNRAEWMCKECLYNSLMASKAQKKAFFTKQSYYEHGEKWGKLLATNVSNPEIEAYLSTLSLPVLSNTNQEFLEVPLMPKKFWILWILHSNRPNSWVAMVSQLNSRRSMRTSWSHTS